ncbi:transcriptional regulator ATRX-like isoform X2 [Uranotaenia lowii]|uniref:transcriptional regulator ATRX-like isoform X2 n=1 Tax=Uranotaenia lowii TaxID=190385 RepID=UPI0024785643|nr:transcriptional regulator ATRX-like isoform X2 [Uranotaenia lowii]
MTTAVEEPDLFNGLEITEMDDINMENGDEYVFIPSDTENEEEQQLQQQQLAAVAGYEGTSAQQQEPAEGSDDRCSSIVSHSVFHQLTSAALLAITNERTNVEVMEEGSGTEQRNNEPNMEASEQQIRIIKRIDLTQEAEDQQEENHRYTVNYDSSLDTQNLFNVDQEEQTVTEGEQVHIKEEIDIEDTVVNLPSDDYEERLETIDLDDHVVGGEVVTLDSDAVVSEDEEDCVLLSLIQLSSASIKQEKPEEDMTPLENDHSYTSQPLDEQKAQKEADRCWQSFVDMSKTLMKEVSVPINDVNNTLASIETIEDQIKNLKQRLLKQKQESLVLEQEKTAITAERQVTSEIPPNLSPESPPPHESTIEHVQQCVDEEKQITPNEEQQQESFGCVNTQSVSGQESDNDNLSVELSENCSERLEGRDVTSEHSDKVEAPGECDLNIEEEITQLSAGNGDSGAHSKAPSPVNIESIEHRLPPGTTSCDPEIEAVEQLKQPFSEANPENMIQEEPVESLAVKCFKVNKLEDLFVYGEAFTEQCEIWFDKLNNNRLQRDEESVEDVHTEEQKQHKRMQDFMVNLTTKIRRLSAKIAVPLPDESCEKSKIEVSVQTERKLSRRKARALNEKYKQKLLGSLEQEAARDSDSSGSSFASNRSSSSNEKSENVGYNEEDENEDAFERRQNRRKARRLQTVSANSTDSSDEESKPSKSKKRNIRRLSSVDSTKEEPAAGGSDSDEDLSKFLIPKSPQPSTVPSNMDEEITIANEPFSEGESEPISRKTIIRTSSVDYNSGEAGGDNISDRNDQDENEFEESISIKQESSINIGITQSKSTLEDEVPRTHDVVSKETEEADEPDDQSDSELLDDVLPQVDDILLDVNDILPAAEGVVQEYLVEEEVRTEQENEQSKNVEIYSPQKSSKRRGGKRLESDNDGGSEDELEKEKQKPPEDMTESELEEYYDNLRDREIDKLCNLTNLEVARNTNPQKPQIVKKKPVIVEKKKDRIEDILNSSELHHYSGDSESDAEVLETEEQFLHKCNENMKNQMLNQLSSSDTDPDSGSEDSILDGLKQDQAYDTDDSAGSILMEKFLKSLNKDHSPSDEDVEGDHLTDDNKDDVDKDDKESIPLNDSGSVDKSKDIDDFIDDSDLPADEDKEEVMEKLKQRLKNVEQSKSSSAPSTKEKTKEKSSTASNKLATLDPIDKQLFSKKMFREVDETLRKDRDSERYGKENGSITDRSERMATDDSDVELLDVSMFQPKRKTKETKLEDFDFSATTAKRATPQMKKKDSKDDDCISLSSESDADVTETDTKPTSGTAENDDKENKSRKIRAMLTQDQLADETKTAQKDEEQRLSRLKRKNEQLKRIMTTFKPGQDESNLVLDYDSKAGRVICVHPDIVKQLKPHQRDGIRFMYDNTYGSVDHISKSSGSGCILAHCMGLGKTLQLITLLHTVMRYPQLKTKRVLVICPKSTVMNWSDEIQHWLGSLKSGPRLKVFFFPDNSDVNDKLKVLHEWYQSTASRCGCMLIGYEAFRILVNYEKRKRTPSNILAAKAAYVKKRVDEYLLDPGADLVICDEGHQIKNKKSAISGAVSQIKTKRRIVLTGTPIQNNLKEYYCMVNFIKPSFLGSDREFNNLYANPIKNGQHKDSDSRAIKIMKQRSYVLHNKLSRFVQRREAGVLKEFLPEKFEYVLFVPLTPVQEKMYEVFLQMNEYTTPTGESLGSENARGKKFKLLADYTSLRKIWTHPKVLEKAWETAVQEKNKRDARFRHTSTPDSDDDRPDDYNDIASGALSVTNDWWRRHLEANDLESLYPSNKLRLMFEILKQCQERGEKCLIFSAFVAVLNVVEHFMAKIHTKENDPMTDAYGYNTYKGPWEPGKDYYRLDGKTQKNIRHKMITSFNDPSNKRTKCFLISAKAGGQGINLIGANRVIILDTSWNPSNDQQNIFRIFRLGQKRKCYVYRLLAMGTMEEKVYSRSVTKQAMSFRVVDEQQIDRHYSFSELAELYNLAKVADQVRETPILPADDVLASLLRNFPDCCFKYHEHDSLLENKPEQDLSEEDKKEAWAAYEREIQNNEKPSYLGNMGMMPNFLGTTGFPGATPGTGIGQYPPLNYAGISGALADMYRSDFGYGMNRLMYPYNNQSYPLMNDPSYSSIMGKTPYPSYSIPGSSSSLPDYGLSAAINGQGPGATTSYNSTVALQSLLDLYAKSMSTGMSSSTITTAMATSTSQSTSTTSAAPSLSIPPRSSTLATTTIAPAMPTPPPTALTTATSKSAATPPIVPVAISSSLVPPVLTNLLPPSVAKPTTLEKAPSAAGTTKNKDPKAVPLTTTVVASDDDDVDDDGIPRPHIIVRDPTSINASSSKQQEKDKVVKKINMGIVYPEEKKKDQSKDILLSAKSITTLAKPTIAVKSMESMQSRAHMAGRTPKPSQLGIRPGMVSGSKTIRSSPIQTPHPMVSKQPQLMRQNSSLTGLRSLPSSPLTTMANAKQPINQPRQQQVPVITSAKSLQLSSPANTTSTMNPVQRISNLSATSSPATPTGQPTTGISRGSIAAQQLRELQKQINTGNVNSTSSTNSSPAGNVLISKSNKKSIITAAGSRPMGTVQPVGIFSSQSAVAASQTAQQTKFAKMPVTAQTLMQGSPVNRPGNTSKASLSDSVSITKITSSGQRIAVSAASVQGTPSVAPNINSPLSNPALNRRQDLIITKSTTSSPATSALTMRKAPLGSTMIMKPTSGATVSPGLKKNFSTPSPLIRKTITGAVPGPTITSISGGATLGRLPTTTPGTSPNSITVRKRKAEPTLIDSLKAKNNSITISEVRSIYNPPAAKKPNTGSPVPPQKRLGSGITITPRKIAPAPTSQQHNVLEVVEIE